MLSDDEKQIFSKNVSLKYAKASYEKNINKESSLTNKQQRFPITKFIIAAG